MARLDFIAAGDNFLTSNGLQYRVRGDIPVNINSFEVVFYQTDSDPRTVDKNLANSLTLQGTLRENTSVVNPVIIVEGTVPGFLRNYAYISIFQRYYFVTDVKSVRKDLWEISLKCDVLMTFKSGILSLNTRVLRSESNHNWDYTDTLVPMKSGASIEAVEPTPLTSPYYGTWSVPYGANTTIGGGKGFIQVKFVASKINGRNLPLGYAWLTMSVGGLWNMMKSIRNAGFGGGDYKINDVILDVQWCPQGWVGQYGYSEKVNSVMYEKWSGIPTYLSEVGMWEANVYINTTGYLGWRSFTKWYLRNPLDEKNYKNRPPFKSMSIWFQPFGSMSIDCDKWGNDSIMHVMVEGDPVSGDAIVYLMKSTFNSGSDNEMLGCGNINVPIDIAAVESNFRQGISSLLSGLTLSTFGNGPSSALLSLGEGAFRTASALTAPPAIVSVSGGGSGNGLMNNYPILLISRKRQDDPHLSTQGWLYNTTATLGNLHGYCLVAPGVHIARILKLGLATKPEIEEIESLLTTGIVLP